MGCLRPRVVDALPIDCGTVEPELVRKERSASGELVGRSVSLGLEERLDPEGDVRGRFGQVLRVGAPIGAPKRPADASW